MIVALLLACTSPHEVVVTCVTNWQDYDYTYTQSYAAFRTSCHDWAESGEARMASEEAACVQDGFDEGYANPTCTCTVDTGRCTFPNGVND